MRVAFGADSIMEAIVRTYDGPHQASVQFDPPIYRADGRWYAWLMLRDDRNGSYSIAGGSGPNSFDALVSLAHMRGLEIETPDIVCDVCGKVIDDGDISGEHKLPGGLVLEVCSTECRSLLDGRG